MKKWKISTNQKKLLDKLFEDINIGEIDTIIDMGSGRTSVSFLANRFKNSIIKAVVYPEDRRKIDPILECVQEKNFKIIEADIKDLKSKRVDLVLAHLFLGEAGKFGNNRFENVLTSLFAIRTKYLIIVNREDDKIDYFQLFKYIDKKGIITKIANQKTSDEHECLGIAIKMK